MAKILNLDKLEPAKRYFQFKGKKYPIEEMTVDNFLITSAEAERLQTEEASVPKQIEATVAMIKRSIPSIQEDLLRKLSLEQLQTVTAFIRGDDEQEGVEEEAEAGK